MEPQKTKIFLYEAALLLVGLIWGGGFMATRIAVDEQLSAPLILAGRFFIAAIIFGCVFWKTIRKNCNRQAILSGMVVGTFLFLGFSMQTMATAGTVPSSVGFLTAINVIIVPFLWWAIAKKRPSRRMIGWFFFFCWKWIGFGLFFLFCLSYCIYRNFFCPGQSQYPCICPIRHSRCFIHPVFPGI